MIKPSIIGFFYMTKIIKTILRKEEICFSSFFKEKFMKKNKKIFILILTLQFLLSSFSFAAPQEFSTSINFSESTSRSRSQVVNIKDLGEVISVVPNTGSATFSKNGENVTVNVSSGAATRIESYTPSTYAGDTLSNSSNSFPGSIYYSSGGYSGSIYKSGGAYSYIISTADSYVARETRYLNTWSQFAYSGNGAWWVYNNSGAQLPGSVSYSSGGYTGTLYKTGGTELLNPWDTFSFPDVSKWKPSDGTKYFSEKAPGQWEGYFEGTVTKPAVTGYKQDYSGTVYGATEYTHYYAYNVTITYTKKVSIPTPPTFSDITTNQIRIDWTANGNEAGTTYQLYCNNTGTILYDGTSTSYLHTGLAINTLYTYKVKAISPANVESAYSSERSASTLTVDPLPDGFDNLTHNSVRLKWLHNGNPVDTSYKYIVKNAGTNTVVKSGIVTGTNATATGLTPNTKYDLYVKAINKSGVESIIEVFIDTVVTLPAKPGIPTLMPGSTRLFNIISWNGNSNPSNTVYEFYIKPLNESYSIFNEGSLTQIDHSFDPWNSFTYKVRAKNSEGVYSAFSDEYFYTDSINPVIQSVLINDGAIYANNEVFKLTTPSTDDLSGVSQMRIKINEFAYGDWIPYNSVYNYDVPTSMIRQGTNTVYIQTMDLAGNISVQMMDTIVYDNIAPMGEITYPQYIITELDLTFNASAYDINPTSADLISGLRNVRFRELNNGTIVKPWGAWEPFATSKFWSFLPGDGLKDIEMEISDNAGNTSIVKLSVVMDTLFIYKAEFTDIVNAPLNNPTLPTSSVVNIKKGYNFTIMVETMGDPDAMTYSFNGQTGNLIKLEDNLFKITLKININDSFDKGILPINITAKRTSDGATKRAVLKINVVGSAFDDFGVNNTN